MPVPLQGSQPGCLHRDLFASPHPTSTLKPNQVSVTTTRARQPRSRCQSATCALAEPFWEEKEALQS